MSRSYRKTPIRGITGARSEKLFKRKENRRERRVLKERIQREECHMIYRSKKYGNRWAGPKDGRCWFGDMLNPTHSRIYVLFSRIFNIPQNEYITKMKKESIESYYKNMRK